VVLPDPGKPQITINLGPVLDSGIRRLSSTPAFSLG
jgi:hypothetical protein